MKEELLHFIWMFKCIKTHQLKTLAGQTITIINPGDLNNADGPDFLNSRIKIGEEEWVGKIEIHIKSSDWIKHKHNLNKKYDNIILHIVYEQDVEVKELTFQKVPTLELKGYLPSQVLNKYEEIMVNQNWIPCQKEIEKVNKFHVETWLNRLLIERIERKTQFVTAIFEASTFDWSQTFFEIACRGFGFKKNDEGFNLLANRITYRVYKKEKENGLENIESLFIGTAGFLPETSNHHHIKRLIEKFNYQKTKYNIEPLSENNWVKGGVRPPNQPFIRLVQLFTFLNSIDQPLLEIMNKDIMTLIKKNLRKQPQGYWKEHINIEISKKGGIRSMGDKSIDGILINSILPFQFFYAKWIKDQTLVNNSLELYESIKPEQNSIISKWNSIGIKATTAAKSQALLELKNNYCSEKKCLFCGIGVQIFKQ